MVIKIEEINIDEFNLELDSINKFKTDMRKRDMEIASLYEGWVRPNALISLENETFFHKLTKYCEKCENGGSEYLAACGCYYHHRCYEEIRQDGRCVKCSINLTNKFYKCIRCSLETEILINCECGFSNYCSTCCIQYYLNKTVLNCNFDCKKPIIFDIRAHTEPCFECKIPRYTDDFLSTHCPKNPEKLMCKSCWA